jgi:hypothetical protein
VLRSKARRFFFFQGSKVLPRIDRDADDGRRHVQRETSTAHSLNSQGAQQPEINRQSTDQRLAHPGMKKIDRHIINGGFGKPR